MRTKKKEQQLGSSGSGQVSAADVKKQAASTPANQKRDAKAATPLSEDHAEKKKEDSKISKVDQIIYLKDFPQNAKDVEAMLKAGLDRLHGVFMIEEIFNREFDSDDEELIASPVKESTRYSN